MVTMGSGGLGGVAVASRWSRGTRWLTAAALALVGGVVVASEAPQARADIDYATCQGKQSVDWASYPDNSNPTTVTGGGVTYTLVQNDQAPVADPDQAAFRTNRGGAQGGQTGFYAMAFDRRNLTDHQELTVRADQAVAGFHLTLLDIDSSSSAGNHRDTVRVTSNLNGTPVTPAVTAAGSAVTSTTDGTAVVLAGQTDVDDTSANGNATISFPSPITSFTIRYDGGTPLSTGGTDPTQQLIGLDDFTWCGLAVAGAKSAGVPTYTAPNYTVDFDYTIDNDSGATGYDPQVSDTLTTRFGTYTAGTPTARGQYTVGTPTIVTNSADPVAANPAFTGSGANTAILAPGVGSIVPDETVVVRVPVTFFPAVVPFSAGSTATVSLDTKANDDTTVQADVADVTTNGPDPDPDADGNPSENTPTPLTIAAAPVDAPSVTPVTPAAPVQGSVTNPVAAARSVAGPDTTTGPQGVPQSSPVLANDTPGDPAVPLVPASLTLLDGPGGDPVDTIVVPDQGTYSVDRTTPTAPRLVFTPLSEFVGTATPADYRVLDTNGTPAESTYTPTLVPLTPPTAAPDTSTGPQGLPQSVDPLANDTPGVPATPFDPTTLTLLDGPGGEPVPSVTVADQGTFTVADGRVLFTPKPEFTGPATPVDYRLSDADDRPATSTYTPTVTPVTPRANPDTSSGPPRQPQSVDPLTNDTPGNPRVPLDPSTLALIEAPGGPAVPRVTVPGEGTHEVVDGRIVFTPETDFEGPSTGVRYRVTDVNGTPAESTYTPTVTPPGSLGEPVRPGRPNGAQLSVTKSVDSGPTRFNRARYELTYRITVANTGTVPLTDVTLSDDLRETFAGAGGFRVVSTTATGLSVNPRFDGKARPRVLTGDDALAPGAVRTVLITVRVAPGDETATYLNTAVGRAECRVCDQPVTDESDSDVPGRPFDPHDPTNSGAPGDTGGQDDPTPVVLRPLTGRGSLAHTGADLGPVGLGVSLILLGGLLTAAARPRRRPS